MCCGPTQHRAQGSRQPQSDPRSAHIHVKTPDGECKFWLSPVRLARVDGVKPTEVRRIEISVIEHEALFLEKWHEHNQS